MAKHIFVTGGVVSSLGKGITAASLGHLLKARGYHVTMQKIDPYLNVDPGTMSPFQHGEVFVTDDGHEGDLDLGHYERFIDESLTRDSNFTQGSIYQSLIARERRGDFLGGTVQVIPHVTNAIKERLYRIASQTNADIVISEIGGTVGDIESQPFIEAARQFKKEKEPGDVIFVHVTLVPYIAAAPRGENQAHAAFRQRAAQRRRAPDFIVCRSDHEISSGVRDKIALFCDVDPGNVLACIDAPSIYSVPLALHGPAFRREGAREAGVFPWKTSTSLRCASSSRRRPIGEGEVNIAIVGKYVKLPDAYLSIMEALHHSGVANGVNVNLNLIDAEKVDDETAEELLGAMDGILVPGGFGQRAFEGKIAAARYARTHNVPYFGICLGLQAAVCEFARDVVGLSGATSSEFDENAEYQVISIMPDQKDIDEKGGTMRLGAYPCKLEKGTKAFDIYGEEVIYERHRHRYEVNNEYRGKLQEAGMVISGVSPDGRLTEMIELPNHPWVRGEPGPPRIQEPPNQAPSVVQRFRCRRAQTSRRGIKT